MRHGRWVVVGRCYVCQQPVRRDLAIRVLDVVVSGLQGRGVRRLAHVGDCARELEHRIGARP